MLFVYPYAKPEPKPSGWQDDLKYSLRSLDKYADNFSVLVMGDYKPDWLTVVDYVYIEKGDNTEHSLGKCYKWLIKNKPNTDIIWMNDDIYALKPVTFEEISKVKVLEDLNLQRYRGKSRWNKLLWATFDMCKEQGMKGLNFETHLPYPINTDHLKYVASIFPILSGRSLLATAFYNTILSDMEMCTNKLGVYKPHDPIIELPRHKWLNHGDYGFCDEIVSFLKGKYPEKSRFELC